MNEPVPPDETEAIPVGLLVARAEAARWEGRYERALAFGRRALTSAPHYSSAHVVVGRSLLECGESSGALEHLGRAVEIDGENPLALNLLGDALVLEGLADEAEAMYEKVAKVAGESEDARFARRLLRLGRSDAAVPDATEEAEGIVRGAVTADGLLRAEDLRFQDGFETVTMARICEEQGILDAALQIYDSLREKYPGASLLVGKTAQLRRRIAEAQEAPGTADGGPDAGEGTGEWTSSDSEN